MPDDPKLTGIVQRMIDAGEPEENIASVIQEYKKSSAPQGDMLLENIRNIGGFIRTTAKSALNHPVQTGAILGGALAAPFTGGGSLAIPAWAVPAAAATLGGAGGAGLGMIGQAAFGKPDGLPTTPPGVFAEMAKQGAIQGVTEGGGQVMQAGLKAAGRGLYQTATRFPTRLTDKYGDLVGAGLSEGAPVGSSGAIRTRMQASKAATDSLVQQAETAGQTVPASAITQRYMPLIDTAAKRERIGVGGDLNEIADRAGAILHNNPPQIAPTEALGMKREADALASTAQRQVRSGAPVNDMTAQIHDATRKGLSEGLDTATAGMTSPEGLSYADQNARTSTLYGLARGLQTAENRPHALTNLATVGTGVASAVNGSSGGDARKGAESGIGGALIMRALLAPKAQSYGGILANDVAGLPAAQLIRAALLARLTSQSDPETNPEPQQ